MRRRTCFNPRLPGGRRPDADQQPDRRCPVSIHAFRGEGDRRPHPGSARCCCFNPRLPGGRRHNAAYGIICLKEFQSTPSGGKATKAPRDRRARRMRFNPRLPGGRRLEGVSDGIVTRMRFNPRLPGGRRRCFGQTRHCLSRFNPRLPGGRRLPRCPRCGAVIAVSIHAFRGEGDIIGWSALPPIESFNPRLPGGRRRACEPEQQASEEWFQSTPSGGKATRHWRTPLARRLFQSTPSGGKATRIGDLFIMLGSSFQSTPSGGKATRGTGLLISF